MGWIITTILLALDSAVGSAVSISNQSYIQKEAKELAKQISSDRELVNKLYTAYVQRDAKLANSLIGASPFSSYYNNTVKEAKKVDKDIKDVSEEIERINKAEADLNNEVSAKSTQHQTSGSWVVDLISGTAREPDTNNMSYSKSKFNQETK